MNFTISRFTALLFLSLFTTVAVYGQNAHNPCLATEMQEKLIDGDPEIREKIREAEEQLEQETKAYKQTRSTRDNHVILVPVVFHILHENGPENISDEQIHDCIRIINEDFNAGHEDLDDVVPSFTSNIGDAEMELRLARVDPNGNPTSGINRYETPLTDAADGQQQKINQWPQDEYLNIWVANTIDASGSAAAYALLPAGANQFPSQDGIMANHRYVGSIGTSNPSRQHAIPHEVGHVFNLQHTWGPGEVGEGVNCNDDDGVNDTPNTIGRASTCQLQDNTCGSLDNVQNIMDYGSCPAMFTEGQVTRMHAAASSPVASRSNLTSQSNAEDKGITELFETSISADRRTFCSPGTVRFSDESVYDPNEWSWTFETGIPEESTDQSPEVLYDRSGLKDVILNVYQDETNLTSANGGYIYVTSQNGQSLPLDEDFEDIDKIPAENWFALSSSSSYGYELTTDKGYDGSKGLRIKNFENTDFEPEYELYSNTLDTRVFESYSISFKTAYARESGVSGFDRLKVYISADCENDWEMVYDETNLTSSSMVNGRFEPSSNSDWETRSIDDLGSEYISQHTRIKIVLEGEGNNDLYLDDISVTGSWKEAIQLVQPADETQNTASSVTLKWQPTGEPISEYEWQADTDPGFSDPEFTGTNEYKGINTTGEDLTAHLEGLAHGETYYWRVRSVGGSTERDWSETWSFNVSDDGVFAEEVIEEKYQINLYPNPAEHTVNLSFQLPRQEEVSWEVRDLSGRILQTKKMGLSAGEHTEQLNASQWPGGVYLINITLSEGSVTKRLIIR